MCLILIARGVREDAPLVVAANRDEFHARPTRPAVFWDGQEGVLAGRDLKAGGTWLGVTRTGRVAGITNLREPDRYDEQLLSRGQLTADFLVGEETPEAYLARIRANGDRYNGYNLVVGSAESIWYDSNRRTESPVELADGVTGFSNSVLAEPWKKTLRAAAAFRRELEGDAWSEQAVFDILGDESRVGDSDLPETGVGIDMERALSARFIRLPEYGTRASTLITFSTDGHVTFVERTWPIHGGPYETRRYRFRNTNN